MLTYEDFVRAKRTDRSWTEDRLREAFESRGRCSLCPKYCDDPHTGIVMVKSRGSENPLILLVGEAPGRDEAREGSAFVGASGDYITKVLTKDGKIYKWCTMLSSRRERHPKDSGLPGDCSLLALLVR